MWICNRNSDKRGFTPEQFQRYFHLLKGEYFSGKDHFDIYLRIDTLLDKYPEVRNSFSDFFDLTEMAHLEVAHLHLCRIYDRTKGDPISVKSFLLSALNNLGEFKHVDQKTARKEIRRDLQLTSPKNDSRIGQLLELRHKSIAHLDSFRVERNSIDRVFKYDMRDPIMIGSLYDDMGKLLDKYTYYLWKQNLFLGAFPRSVKRIISALNNALGP